MRTRRAGALACALLLAFVALAAARADDSPALVSLASVSNGCGGGVASEDPRFFDALDYGGIKVSFRQACNVHDACYSGAVVRDPFTTPPDRIVDFRGWSQERCDDAFLANMQTLCRKQIPTAGTSPEWDEARDDCQHGSGPTLPSCTTLVSPIPNLGNQAIGAAFAHRVVRKCGHRFFRERVDLSGTWINDDRGSTSVRSLTIRQTGRAVTATWTGEPDRCGSGSGTLVTRDQNEEVVGDAEVTGFANGGVFRGRLRIVTNEDGSITVPALPGSPTLQRTGRSTQALAAQCSPPTQKPKPSTTPQPAAGTFVLVGSRVVENPYGKEVTIDTGGHASWNRCCDGATWKTDYTWKVPGALVPGRPFSISLALKTLEVVPRQPMLDQMSALAPGFRQDLTTQYIGQPSAAKTYSVPFAAGYRTDPNNREVKLYIAFAHATVEYTYRRR
jgi:hypothetical protein